MGLEMFGLGSAVHELARGWKYGGEFPSREIAEAKFALRIALQWEVDIIDIEDGGRKVKVYVRSPADLAAAKFRA
ncbi:hypothetical protein EPO56_00585 [Patescibacteria group bacterium]|nr:MAG: hypothetical protein EPO56_00585 [Patescibacteria group bacterium]